MRVQMPVVPFFFFFKPFGYKFSSTTLFDTTFFFHFGSLFGIYQVARLHVGIKCPD